MRWFGEDTDLVSWRMMILYIWEKLPKNPLRTRDIEIAKFPLSPQII